MGIKNTIPNLIEGLEDKGRNLPKSKEKRERWKWGKTDEKVRAPAQEVRLIQMTRSQRDGGEETGQRQLSTNEFKNSSQK